MGKKAIVAGCLALGLALTGCSQSTPGKASPAFGNAQELALAAKSETAKTKSARFTFEMNMMGQKVTGGGAGRFDGADTAMSMTMDVFGQQMEMRFVDKAMYMKLPQGMPGMGQSKPWVKVPADGNGPMSKMLGGTDQMLEQNDPSKTLEQIQKAGRITRSEQTQLDGQPVTHYWVDLQLAKLAGQVPGGMSGQSLEGMRKAGIESIPVQLWLNQDNLPVQFTTDMTAVMKTAAEQAGQQLPGGMRMSMTMKYHDWGAEVNVQPPPADQVGEMPSMPGMGSTPGMGNTPGAGGAPGFGQPTG